eukprot:CFRG5371T1
MATLNQSDESFRKVKKEPEILYPSKGDLLQDAIIGYIRGPAIGALFVLVLWPLYEQTVEWWKTNGPFDGSERFYWILGTVLVHETLYWGMNSIFLLCDVYGWLAKYKLPRTKRMIHTDALFKETLWDAVLNHFLSQPISLYVLYPLVKGGGMPSISSELPSFSGIMRDLAMCKFWNEFLFYFVHRLFHEVPSFYKKIHKQHHRYVGTIGFAAEFAHPVENIIANQLPTVFYSYFFGVHPLIYFAWLGWRMVETYEAHSGYCFSRSFFGKLGLLHGGHAAFHDAHHTINTGNYGSPLFDGWFGTMDQWVKDGMEEEQ